MSTEVEFTPEQQEYLDNFNRSLIMTDDNAVSANISAVGEDINANDIIRKVLVNALIELAPVLINRYLTNDVIEKLINRALSRVDEI